MTLIMCWKSCIVFCAYIYLVSTTSEPNVHRPVLQAIDDAGHNVRSYHGLIKENEGSVRLTPALRATDDDVQGGSRFICGYKIFVEGDVIIPFAVVLSSHITGEANIVLEHGVFLDYEVQMEYKFQIAAYDCGTPALMSEKLPVQIEVQEFSEPIWAEDSYFVEVEEGVPKETLVQVRAYERHKTAGNRICSYKILTPDVPFTVDSAGNIKLKQNEKLDYSNKHNHIVAVEATDCMGRKSAQVMVNFKVTKACVLGWEGIPEKIDYYPGSGRKSFASRAHFNKCGAPCSEDRVTTSVYLTTKHIGKGCDRDTYSIRSQRKLCGAISTGSVDLLSSPDLYSTLTKDQPHDQIYGFDGKSNAVKVPAGKINHTLSEHFTIMTWMRHQENLRGNKETVLCNADGEEMSRPHYSLFIHNCRLVFLLRREFTKKDYFIFKPAEWRWRIPEVCDNTWHHYAVSVDFPQVRLYIDGRLHIETKHNPEVVDDWPLHKTNDIHFTELVVGACWEGGEKHLGHYFRGNLAGLVITRGKSESDSVIRCLNNCQEKLDFHAIYMMEGGMSISYNSAMTQLTINSRNMSQVEKILNEVGYINYRMYPTAGRRDIKITTEIKCSDQTPPIVSIPDVLSYVLVNDAHAPVITLSGQPALMRYEPQFISGGVKLFQDLLIRTSIVTMTTSSFYPASPSPADKQRKIKRKLAEEFAEQALFKSKIFENDVLPKPVLESGERIDEDGLVFKLDSCLVTLDRPLTSHELITVPADDVKRLGLEATSTRNGLTVTGAATLANYESVFRQVHYVNKKPDQTRARVFSLRCSELNGRFVSNEFRVEVSVIHTIQIKPAPPHHAQSNVLYKNQGQSAGHVLEPLNIVHKDAGVKGHDLGNTDGGHATSFNTVVIVVICAGFLMFMVVLGVIRVRDARNRTKVVHVEERGEEMEWDNSALTITVNPMEQDGLGGQNYGELDESAPVVAEESDSDEEDGSSYRDDDLESSEDEPEKVKSRGDLEWDDSTLSF